MSALGQRYIRREMDRLAGELLRRQSETDVCLGLYARRELLRAKSLRPHHAGCAARQVRAAIVWLAA